MDKLKKHRIISIEAEKIIRLSSGDSFSAFIDGKYNTKLFRGILDYSIESEKIHELWSESPRITRKMYFTEGKFDYTTAVVNVTFEYVLKENDEVLLGRRELREKLYAEGFDLDAIHYVRYKRSAGSSRAGSCLFIAEPLYKKMMAWSLCGLDIGKNKNIDLASLEAYKALSLSSIKGTIEIPKKSILFLKDAKSVFKTSAAVVKRGEKNSLLTEECETEVENTIWDGEALLDTSMFSGEYSAKGMMLLRNRFFKTCAFNTNLQKFFADNGITEVSQLCGYTQAQNVSDIKLVVTESSVKYLKLADPRLGFEENIDLWLANIDPIFGIVKTDQPTGFFDGRMVRTNYQIINTLGLDKDETDLLLCNTFNYFYNVSRDPMYMRNYINYTVSGDDNLEGEEELEISAFNLRSQVVFDMLSVNDDFARTKFYKEFKKTVTKSFSRKIRNGKLLVGGTYATLFGNGLEFLYATVGKYEDGDAAVAFGGEDKLYCKHFPVGTKLLGARSPHITMGNLLFAENTFDERIDKYFNLSREIVYINAIGSNIQQRLNGCDYDSDTMLLTDDEAMVAATERNSAFFAVPVCPISTEKKQYKDTPTALVELDYDISQNKIGEIVNLSQRLNSLYWHRVINTPEQAVENNALYLDTCTLAVLSGMEIDKAKRNYNISTASVLTGIANKYYEEIKLYPEFFNFITDKGKPAEQRMYYDTTMDYLCGKTLEFTSKLAKHKDKTEKRLLTHFADIIKKQNADEWKSGKNDSREFSALIAELCVSYEKIKHLRSDLRFKENDEKTLIVEEINEIYEKCVELLSKKLTSNHLLYMFLQGIDTKFASVNDADHDLGFAWFVFELICSEPKHRLFYKAMSASRDKDIYNLDIDECGNEPIYGILHKRNLAKNAKID